MSALTHRRPAANRRDGHESATRRAGGFSGMLWLTWRQHRWALIASLVLTALLVGWLLHLSHDMTTLYNQCRDTHCSKNTPKGAALWAGDGPILLAEILVLVVQYTPLLIGVFVGVPVLSREYEQRTLLLAWSQDVSPMRWLWTKLALLGLFVATLTAMLSAVTDHLAHVYSNITGASLFGDRVFPVTGMLPLASSVCWFAVGVALGAPNQAHAPRHLRHDRGVHRRNAGHPGALPHPDQATVPLPAPRPTDPPGLGPQWADRERPHPNRTRLGIELVPLSRARSQVCRPATHVP
jgi:hypothetical protein